MGGLRLVFERRFPWSLFGAQWLELDADEVTIRGWRSIRTHTWRELQYMHLVQEFPLPRVLVVGWDEAVPTPHEIANVKPSVPLRPWTPVAWPAATDFEEAMFPPDGRGGGGCRLLRTLCLYRLVMPGEDWLDQVATVFEARDACGFGPPETFPVARVYHRRE